MRTPVRLETAHTAGEGPMRVIVVGAGEVGSNIAASLDDDHNVVVIDTDPDRIDAITYAYDVLAIQATAPRSRRCGRPASRTRIW